MGCEEWPCCGHELGCCPDYDEDGKQLNMKCTCGAPVPLSSRSSLCEGCLHPKPGHPDFDPNDYDAADYDPLEDEDPCDGCELEIECADCDEQ